MFGLFRPFQNTYAERLLLFVTVLSWHLVADEITRRHGSGGTTAVRVDGKGGLDDRNTSALASKTPILLTMVKQGQKFYSFYQIAAVCTHLLPCERTSDLGYNTIIAIQSSAFLMTLYRKGLIFQHSHAFWYSSALVLSFFHMWRIYSSPLLWARIVLLFACRCLGANKYLLYCMFALVVEPLLAGDFGVPTFTSLDGLDSGMHTSLSTVMSR